MMLLRRSTPREPGISSDFDARAGGGAGGASKSSDRQRIERDVEVGFEGDSNFFIGFYDVLSDGGLFIATYQPLPVGTEFALSFDLPYHRGIQCRAIVVWLRALREETAYAKPGMGVHLEALAPADQFALLAL